MPKTVTPTATLTPTGPTATPTATATPSGTVTPGSGLLSVDVNAPNRVLAGSSMNTTIIVEGSDAIPVDTVSVTLDFPSTIQLVSASPSASSTQTASGHTIVTWNVGTVGGTVSRQQVQVRHSVPDSIAAGTMLDLLATVSAPSHSIVQTLASVEVRD